MNNNFKIFLFSLFILCQTFFGYTQDKNLLNQLIEDNKQLTAKLETLQKDNTKDILSKENLELKAEYSLQEERMNKLNQALESASKEIEKYRADIKTLIQAKEKAVSEAQKYKETAVKAGDSEKDYQNKLAQIEALNKQYELEKSMLVDSKLDNERQIVALKKQLNDINKPFKAGQSSELADLRDRVIFLTNKVKEKDDYMIEMASDFEEQMSESEKNVLLLKREAEVLRNENEVLKRQVEAFQTRIAMAEAKDQIESEVSQADKEHDASGYETVIERLKDENARLKKETIEAKKEISLLKDNAMSNKQTAATMQDIQKYKEMNNDLLTQLNQQVDLTDKSKKELDTARKELADVTAGFKDNTKVVERLTDANKLLSEQLAKLKKDSEQSKKDFDNYKGLAAANKVLAGQVETLSNKNKKLEDDLREFGLNLNESDSAYKKIELENEELRSKLEELTTKIVLDKESSAVIIEEKLKIEGRNKELIAQNTFLTDQVSELKGEITHKNRNIDSDITVIKNLEAEIGDLKRENDNLKNENISFNNFIENVQNELHKKIMGLEKDNSDKEKIIDSLNKKISDGSAKTDAYCKGLKERVEELEAENAGKQIIIEKLKTELDGLTDRFVRNSEKHDMEKEQLKANYENVKKEISADTDNGKLQATDISGEISSDFTRDIELNQQEFKKSNEPISYDEYYLYGREKEITPVYEDSKSEDYLLKIKLLKSDIDKLRSLCNEELK
ncbi:MAG: hypothetical protein PHP69_00105 [Candidatus Omnitrophica bacterium]|nr:hypothetical protein [Candidatus Omnitrophota bacterium]MDD5081449.1 hypothetical protein [Candidatus Omnitrophota bacterium]